MPYKAPLPMNWREKRMHSWYSFSTHDFIPALAIKDLSLTSLALQMILYIKPNFGVHMIKRCSPIGKAYFPRYLSGLRSVLGGSTKPQDEIGSVNFRGYNNKNLSHDCS